MQHKDFVTELPAELTVDGISPHLSLFDVNRALRVSTGWHGLFNKDVNVLWKRLIIRHFSISCENMALFISIVNHDIDFYSLCETMQRVIKRCQQHNITAEDVLHPEMQLQFLAVCLDDEAVARAIIPEDEKSFWLTVSLHADSLHVFRVCMEGNVQHIRDDDIISSLDKSRLNIFSFLFTPGNFLSIRKEQRSYLYERILNDCSLLQIQWLLDHRYSDSPPDGYFLFHLLKNEGLPLKFIYDIVIKYNLIAKLISSPNPLSSILRKQQDPGEHLFIELFSAQGFYPPHVDSTARSRLAERKHHAYLKKLMTHVDHLPCLPMLTAAAASQCLTRDLLLFLYNPPSRCIGMNNGEILATLIEHNYFDEFLFLIDTTNNYSFTISQITLKKAAESPHPRFLAWMLTSRKKYGLQVNSDILEAAVCFSYSQENVRILIEQEKLALTEKMLIAFIKTHGSKVITAAHMEYIKFLLRPEFNVTCTQATFDLLLVRFRFINACFDQAYPYLLFFLNSRFNLTISTEQLQSFYCHRHFQVANLLDDPRFPHLKPTKEMVRSAIYSNIPSDVTYFLQPYYGLPIELTYLNDAAEHNRAEIIQFLLGADPTLIPTQQTITLLLRIGNITLAQQLLDKYNIEINYEKFLNDVVNYRSDSQAFGLALAEAHGVYPNASMLRTLYGGNLQCLRRVLDPRYAIDFTERMRICPGYLQDKPATKQLIQCHIAMTQALQYLAENNTTRAEQEFNRAINLSRRHFFRVVTYALANPHRYQLDESAQKNLLAFLTNELTEFSHFTAIEQREIGQFVTSISAMEKSVNFRYNKRA